MKTSHPSAVISTLHLVLITAAAVTIQASVHPVPQVGVSNADSSGVGGARGTSRKGFRGRRLLQGSTGSGCAPGWLPAVGTIYDSWPKPGTVECVDYSGCKWAGMFMKFSPGPCAGPCDGSMWGSAARLDGGNGEVCCRWPPEVVARASMAATWEKDPALLGKVVQVQAVGGSTNVTVNVMDVCADSDCDGCCSFNTGAGAFPLLDLEKVPASLLLGFDTGSPTFDVNDMRLPDPGTLRPGTPRDRTMALCYRVVGEVPRRAKARWPGQKAGDAY